MRNPRSRAALAAVVLALGLAAPAAAQPAAPADSAVRPIESYRREVFRYQRGGRPDPFQPLLSAADLGYRVEDLRLASIVYSPNPRQSIAVFTVGDSAGRHRLRTGQRLGSITVLAIYPRRVDVQVNDFGVARVQSLTFQRTARTMAPGPGAGAAAASGGTTQPVIIQAPAPAQPAAPSGPLRRGGQRRPAEQQPGAQPQPAAPQQQPRTQQQPRGNGATLARPSSTQTP
ncbi:MAG TPA: hypothetical protein VGB92_01435 [Longimicrobium sp.]